MTDSAATNAGAPGVPAGYQSVIPYICTLDAAHLLAFYETAFGATVTERITREDGAVTHAELRIGDTLLMVGQRDDGSDIGHMDLYHYLPDVDATFKRALEAGAKASTQPTLQNYGDKVGSLLDPAGHTWWLATRMETLSPEEIQRLAVEREAAK